MARPTPGQDRVLEFIKTFRAERGFSPSYREIGDGLGLGSTNSVSQHVKALVKRGLLTRVAGQSRTLIPVVPPSGPAVPQETSCAST